eukprot:scaffold193105_cov30-Tisochrysis_lutea.AAC.2
MFEASEVCEHDRTLQLQSADRDIRSSSDIRRRALYMWQSGCFSAHRIRSYAQSAASPPPSEWPVTTIFDRGNSRSASSTARRTRCRGDSMAAHRPELPA